MCPLAGITLTDGGRGRDGYALSDGCGITGTFVISQKPNSQLNRIEFIPCSRKTFVCVLLPITASSCSMYSMCLGVTAFYIRKIPNIKIVSEFWGNIPSHQSTAFFWTHSSTKSNLISSPQHTAHLQVSGSAWLPRLHGRNNKSPPDRNNTAGTLQ